MVRSFVSVRKSRSLNYCTADVYEWKSRFGFESMANKRLRSTQLDTTTACKKNGQVRDKSQKSKKEIVVRIMKAASVPPLHSAATPLGYVGACMSGVFPPSVSAGNTQNLSVAPSTGRFDVDRSAELVKKLGMRLFR
jgi:hypothetical protein